jgi:hypothetical protein
MLEIVGGDYEFKSDPDELFRDAFGRNPFTEFFGMFVLLCLR